jgi:hypothetical protein
VAAGTQHLETQPAFIECLLRDAPCTVELSSYAIPESHYALAVSMSRSEYGAFQKEKPPSGGGLEPRIQR